MPNNRDVEKLIKSILKLIDEAKNLEKGVEGTSSKKILKFETTNNLIKSKNESYSDWSEKKFTNRKVEKKSHLLNKKIATVFEEELREWIHINLKKVLS
tara:strand:- start:510 stop:806 length:297 start_codon:yes stop_codon:yes gene_type:complete